MLLLLTCHYSDVVGVFFLFLGLGVVYVHCCNCHVKPAPLGFRHLSGGQAYRLKVSFRFLEI